MEALNKNLSIFALLMFFAAPLSLESIEPSEQYTAKKTYTPSSALSSIYQELRDNPDKYDLEKAGESKRAAIREYGYERAYPLLRDAILEQDYITEVRNLFTILMETPEGEAIAEETALTILRDEESASVSKQLVALGVVGEIGNPNNAPAVRVFLKNEDQRLKLKASEILDGWTVDSVLNTSPVKEFTGVTAPEPAIEKEPAEVDVAEPTEEAVEQSSQWWLWLIGAVVVVGGIGLIACRKS